MSTVSKKIVAIGGGENGRITNGIVFPYETGPMDLEIIKLTNKTHPHFLFLAHSHESEEIQDGYFETMKKIYAENYGCECRHLKSKDLDNKELVEELIDWADIIYEGGGNTLDMIARWQNTGFDKTLRKAWESGKVMCGVSAGANCWFKECSSDSLKIKEENDDRPLIKVDCLGFIPGLFVPHCDEPGRRESVKDDLLKKSKEVGISMSNCTALEIIDDKYRLITSDASFHGIKPYGLKSYWKNGEYIEIKLDDSKEFKPLKELIEKNIDIDNDKAEI